MPTNATSTHTRRGFLTAVAGTGSVALAGCLGGNSSSYPDDPTPVDGPVTTAPLPDDPADYSYAVMGSSDAPVPIVYFGSWKCPYCADFSTGFLRDIVTDYVEAGDVTLQFRGVAYLGGSGFLGSDAPTATRAGLSVWNHDPETYWKFHEFVLANQPPESKTWATTETMVEFAEGAGVDDVDAVRTDLENEAYEELLTRTTDDAKTAGIRGTPKLVVGGTVVNALDERKVRSQIENAL